jgi:hypothetical protein
VKIVAEIAHQCANDPERLLPTIERDENLRVLVHSAFAFQHVWETQGAALARERGWVRLPDGFRDALSDWRRRWRHAFCEPIDRGLAESLGEMDGTPFDPDEPRPVPRHTWRLVQSREYDADEAIEHPWLHMAQGLAAAESWLDSKAEFHETVDDEYAVEVRAGAVALKALGEQLGGWKTFGTRLDDFEPVAVPLDVVAHHGASNHASLLRWIEECRRAYMFGTPMVAVSAARTVLQVILPDHWPCRGRAEWHSRHQRGARIAARTRRAALPDRLRPRQRGVGAGRRRRAWSPSRWPAFPPRVKRNDPLR